MADILTLNAGSSSIKFALYATADEPVERLRGQIEGLGTAPRLIAKAEGKTIADEPVPPLETTGARATLGHILAFLNRTEGRPHPVAVGHRIVHGGPDRTAPLILNDTNFKELEAYKPLAPLHQPHNLAGVEAARQAFPDALQIACFDTAFHRAHPWVADTYALPTHFYDEGIRRYGFHGLAYEFATQALRVATPENAKGRVIIAHLGNGASMCATHNGQSLASSMGFTALDGLAMGTRCGQLDPGLVLHLLSEKGMTAKEVETLLYRESGLKGLSGISHDMRVLEAAGTQAARRAIDYFVHRIRREIGAQAAILGGLDLLAFSGGIGENAANIRAKVCADFKWLGLELDAERNTAGAERVSADGSRVEVRIVKCNEELVIARHCMAMLARSDLP